MKPKLNTKPKTNSVSEMSQKSKGWATEYSENQN
jgi:hypothetical protein